MKTTAFRRGTSLLLALCMIFSLALGCTGCGGADGGTGTGVGGGASAASMFLRKTEGTVAVADGEGKEVAPAENLGLYSGYTVGTEAASYAWIDLDKVKLTKLDANSAAEITKDGKNLSIDVTSGSLFFNVTESLAEDETMEIRTSSMLVGIRGTCGWVEVLDSSTMRVYLLEGKVECTSGESTAMVNAGEMAEMATDGKVTVKGFTRTDIPIFVVQELLEDDGLKQAVQDASGVDIASDSQNDDPDVSSWLDGEEILFKEEFDFEADGSPELMLISTQGEGDAVVRIFRKGMEQSQQLMCSSRIRPNDNISNVISLVESEGRLFICIHWEYNSLEGDGVNEQYSYYGSTAQTDGADYYWGRIDGVRRQGVGDSLRYHRNGLSGNDLRGNAEEDSTIEEYEAVVAQYTEGRVLWEA